ncbi:hypothetical protein PF008_g31040 [Phytophthora fragariae]|uniref:Secreted protein n=1 Tax=Phytophthora fragariae TaxID=53985 RepID=A0A6G0Q3X4_9STRA|nr:hypothetical protein PF008_g31040 [Phytophthora fragariae]
MSTIVVALACAIRLCHTANGTDFFGVTIALYTTACSRTWSLTDQMRYNRLTLTNLTLVPFLVRKQTD